MFTRAVLFTYLSSFTCPQVRRAFSIFCYVKRSSSTAQDFIAKIGSVNGIPLVDWPPYSPDLNPIEHAWAKLKERIYLIHLELESFGGTKGQLKELFFKAMEDSWESLGQNFFDGLVRSMENRVNAVLEAKGWYNHY